MNTADGPIRYDQSEYAGYRTPSRDYERRAWEVRRQAILEGWQAGLTANGIQQTLKTAHPNAVGEVPATATVRSWFQRIYNELQLINRTPAAALVAAYRTGLLPCPCHGEPLIPTDLQVPRGAGISAAKTNGKDA